MALTLNQVSTKIAQICTGHKQIRSFFYGLKTDLLTAKTTAYPAAFLDDNGGTISPKGHAITLVWRLWFLDLVNVDSYSNQNEIDVVSDMLSVAVDIMTQLSRDSNGWVCSDGAIQQVAEQDNDMPWGVYVDFNIRFPYPQNNCEVPTNTVVP
jgi:hypothetical protein